MKILSVTPNCYKKTLNFPQKQGSKNISFGAIKDYAPKDTQIYRCIGEEEYQKLINNETILSSGFVTTNPQGWGATGWNNGFMPQSRGGFNHYFITFKKGRFNQIIDYRESEEDTKYRIKEAYSLSDIENIRKGNNTHGELVWAENFEEEKTKDVEEKKSIIFWLTNMQRSNNPKLDRWVIRDELSSYQQEFPQLDKILYDV